MRLLRPSRWLLLTLILLIVPASSFAGVFISVGFAPPVLPVYVQPPCPRPGLMWTPGYWAYGDDGYYWVPGAWVPAPYMGALWTPPYWGWEGGMYLFHPGYWGPHVGYYGGVNYGFGYMGVGFVGGEWRGREFAYNTAVMRVNTTVIHNTYVNNTIVRNTTIINNNHVSYNGGPGGIQHQPAPQERIAMRDQHMAPTQMQMQHAQAARMERSSYFNNNHGRPVTAAVAHPWNNQNRPSAMNQRPQTFNNQNRGNAPHPNSGYQNRQPNAAYEGRGYGQPNNGYQDQNRGNQQQWQRPNNPGANNRGPNNRSFEQRPQQQWQNQQRNDQRFQQRPQDRPQERPAPEQRNFR